MEGLDFEFCEVGVLGAFFAVLGGDGEFDAGVEAAEACGVSGVEFFAEADFLVGDGEFGGDFSVFEFDGVEEGVEGSGSEVGCGGIVAWEGEEDLLEFAAAGEDGAEGDFVLGDFFLFFWGDF